MVTVLEITVILFFGSWFLLILWLTGMELGRRWRQRRSEPRQHQSLHEIPGWVSDAFLEHQRRYPDCTLCNPQQTSPQASALSTGRGSGLAEQHSVSLDSTREPRAEPENED